MHRGCLRPELDPESRPITAEGSIFHASTSWRAWSRPSSKRLELPAQTEIPLQRACLPPRGTAWLRRRRTDRIHHGTANYHLEPGDIHDELAAGGGLTEESNKEGPITSRRGGVGPAGASCKLSEDGGLDVALHCSNVERTSKVPHLLQLSGQERVLEKVHVAAAQVEQRHARSELKFPTALSARVESVRPSKSELEAVLRARRGARLRGGEGVRWGVQDCHVGLPTNPLCLRRLLVVVRQHLRPCLRACHRHERGIGRVYLRKGHCHSLGNGIECCEPRAVEHAPCADSCPPRVGDQRQVEVLIVEVLPNSAAHVGGPSGCGLVLRRRLRRGGLGTRTLRDRKS